VFLRGHRNNAREPNRECRSFTQARTLGSHRTAVLLDNLTGDGQTKAESGMATSGSRVGLSEAIEHVWKKVRTEPLTRIGGRVCQVVEKFSPS
jgi:hypothetical protein